VRREDGNERSAYLTLSPKQELSERLNDDAQPEGRNVLWFLLLAAAAEFQAKHV
jgi:hypothetical protein